MVTQFRNYALVLSLLLSPVTPDVGADPGDGAGARPNLIFILTDDLGWGDLGVLFQNGVVGNKRLHTPHLDQMAAEGMLLRRHYCPAPVCAPSRASLLTGMHQGHATVRNNQFDDALEDNHNLANVLHQSGYATALIGKYGLQGAGNSPSTWPAYPTARGFDSFYGYVRHGDGHNHYPAHQTAARPPKQVWDNGAEVSGALGRCYTTDLWTARAKKFLVDHQGAAPTQPFFLFLAYDTPHASLDLPTQAYPAGAGLSGGVQWQGTPGAMINTASGTIDSFVHPAYQGLGWTDGEQRFATMVRRLDEAIGDVLQTLRDLGLDDDTLVVLSSDNGPHAESYLPGVAYQPNAFDSFGPFDGIKRDTWEGGIRVPTLAWWPGTVPASAIEDRPSQFHDWLPTFVELAGVTPPGRVDGVSLVPTLTSVGEQRAGTVYVEYDSPSSTPSYPEFDPSHRGRARNQQQVILLDGFKGVRVNIQSASDRFEIYDLAQDPREANNLAASSGYFVDLERRMRERVLRLRKPSAGAPRPYDNQPVPPVAGPVRAGLEVTAFEGVWPWVPELDGLVPLATGRVSGLDVAAHLSRPNDAALSYRGLLEVPLDGVYTLRIVTDQRALVWLHDVLVVDGDYPRPAPSVAGSLRLAAGRHPLRIDFHQSTGAATFELRWSGPVGAEVSVPTSAYSRPDRSLGAAYCVSPPNSTGLPGRISVEGSPVIADGELLLVADQLPTQRTGIFLTSRAQGNVAMPGGSVGTLCLGGGIGRFVGPGEVRDSGASGSFELAIDPRHLPTPNAFVSALFGESWHFQAWHRDVNPGPTSNFTDAVVVTLL